MAYLNCESRNFTSITVSLKNFTTSYPIYKVDEYGNVLIDDNGNKVIAKTEDDFNGYYRITWWLKQIGEQSYSNKGNNEYHLPVEGTDDLFTFTGLKPATGYYIQCTIQAFTAEGTTALAPKDPRFPWGNEEDGTAATVQGEFWTSDLGASSAGIEYVRRTPNSLTVQLTKLDATYNLNTRYVKWYINGVYVYTEGFNSDENINNEISESQEFKLTGLEPATAYEIACEVYCSGVTYTNYIYYGSLWTADIPVIALAGKGTYNEESTLIVGLSNGGDDDIISFDTSYGVTVQWYAKNVDAAVWYEMGDTKRDEKCTITGLEYGTNYNVACTILYDKDKKTYYQYEDKQKLIDSGNVVSYFTTGAPTPYLTFTEFTSESVTFNIENILASIGDMNRYGCNVFIYWTEGTNWASQNEIEITTYSTGGAALPDTIENLTIDGLSPSTYYSLRGKIVEVEPHNGKEVYTAISYVKTADEYGEGGGATYIGKPDTSGGGTTEEPVVDPTVPVIKKGTRIDEDGYCGINVQLTNIPDYSNKTDRTQWVVIWSVTLVDGGTYQISEQDINAGETETKEICLGSSAQCDFYHKDVYISCVIWDKQDAANHTVLCDNILPVLSEYFDIGITGSWMLDENHERVYFDVFGLSKDTQSVHVSFTFCNESGAPIGLVYGVVYCASFFIDGKQISITKDGYSFTSDDNPELYWDDSASPYFWTGQISEYFDGREHGLTIQAYLGNDIGTDPHEGKYAEYTETILFPSSRPENWVWETNVASGAAIPFSNGSIHTLTASEWNGFTTRINEFRAYKGLGSYAFTAVNAGDAFTKAIYNEAVAAINEITDANKNTISSADENTNALLAETYLVLNRNLNLIS